jgi:pimeloyl-ACP methyl ester carboxylesterase
MPFATSPDGVRIHYEIEGSGSWLVLQTGGAGHGTMWRDAGYLDVLAGSYRCVLLDHRGHGLSDAPSAPDAHRIERYVTDIISVLDAVGAERAAFWGYSQGADVGLELAATRGERLAALVTTGVVDDPDPAQAHSETLEALGDIKRRGWDAIVPDYENADIPAWFKRQIAETDPRMVALWWEANVDRTPWARFPLIDAPVFMVVGEEEDPHGWNAEAARRMPRAEVLRLAGLDHLSAYVRSDLVLPDVMRFLTAVYP